MNIINESLELLPIPEPTDAVAVLKHLERVGRICYHSEDKITDESFRPFIQSIRDRKHWAMLEHYIFAVYIPKEVYLAIIDSIDYYDNDADLAMKMPFVHYCAWDAAPSEDKKYILSASATAFNYLWDTAYYRGRNTGIAAVCIWMATKYPELMKIPEGLEYDISYSVYDDDDFKFIGREEMKSLPLELRKQHDFMSIRFTVDRGVSHELVRHRPASWAQESTRYCNYSLDKEGNEITVINPKFYNDPAREEEMNIWKETGEFIEDKYMKLISLGSKLQEARTVLFNSLKTNIVMTATMYEMRHFFNMRADKPAHPQMKEVAVPLLAKCIDNENEMFGDMAWRLEENHEFV